MARAPFRLRLAKAILGSKAKEFIPPLPSDGDFWGASGARLNDYRTKQEQLKANVGWCFAANNAIVEPTAAIKFKLMRKKKDGERVEVTSGPDMEILELLDAPNLAHTGEQLRQLHYSYMNFVGESYTYMRGLDGGHFQPGRGKLPAALEIFPAHLVQFKLGDTYTASTVKYSNNEYPITSVVRDLNPDPDQPYFGRSIIKATALTIDTENQMKEWNRGVFARGGRPSMVVQTEEEMSDDVFKRFKKQIDDQFAGTENSHRPIVVEGKGSVTPYMMSQQDLDFLASRKFSKDEILAMWRVSPGILGMLENANRSNLDAVIYLHAYINELPRVRQLARQHTMSWIRQYDPTLELDFENPVPEDVEAKLNAAKAGTNAWWTIDEVRAMYGDKPLPDDLGSQMIVIGKGAVSLESVLNDDAPEPTQSDQGDTNAEPADDSGANAEDIKPKKSLDGVKKKT